MAINLQTSKQYPTDCTFCITIEKGYLESQAVMLVESLRNFGGVYSNCPIVAISPRPLRKLSTECISQLSSQGVEVVLEDLLPETVTYGPVARHVAAAWAEKNIESNVLVNLDNDTFFVSEPDFRLAGADIIARPVDLKGRCTTGKEDDPYTDYWKDVSTLCGVDYYRIPMVRTTIDRINIKASYNGGMTVSRRDLGIFTLASEYIHLLLNSDRFPYQTDANHFKMAELVDKNSSYHWWTTCQIVFSLAATHLHAKVSLAPHTYNIPVHAKPLSIGQIFTLRKAVLVHYHWLLDKEHFDPKIIFPGFNFLPYKVRDFIIKRVPLDW
jgi:hypothetical protein